MGKYLLVFLGGGLGSAARFVTDATLTAWWPAMAARFPIGTLTVNVVGCGLFGLVCGCHGGLAALSDVRRLLLLTGFMGGFTTFSTFGNDTVRLLTAGTVGLAILNVALSVAAGLLALWGGLTCGAIIAGK